MVFLWQVWRDCDKMENDKKSISSLSLNELMEVLQSLGQPSFRAKQIFGWLHQKQVESFNQMSNLPADLREELQTNWRIDIPTIAQKQVSKDGTVKYLLRLSDDNCIETVLMKYNYGNTVCVSSQVGCKMGCKFCASTQGGIVRNLTAGEIAGQIERVMLDTKEKVSHIVLMGIGEPLDNFENVLRFIEIITNPNGIDLSMRNITLSTCGVVPKIYELAEKKLGITLSISLHAPNNVARSAMMPVNNKWNIQELLQACKVYRKTTGRRISFEYAMVRGVNDRQKDALEISRLLKGMDVHVNLIPINPVDGSPYGPTDEKNVLEFKAQLEKLGVNATVRRRLGTDISAACGQLRKQSI